MCRARKIWRPVALDHYKFHYARVTVKLTEYMNRALKTLLLWLLIAALPLQGLAAVIQASCGPAHHDGSKISALTNQYHHDSEMAPDHHGAAATHHYASELPATSDHTSAPEKHQSSVCSACAACCVGAVALISPPSIFIPAHTSSELVVISTSPLVTGFIPAGLERPPKHILA